jgi:phenylpropionate dioxygenase-like ring-hydroxylating dioxygenase large terminal subunit
MSAKPHRSPRYANHLTPLIRNAWYVAARSSEIGSGLLARTLLEQRVVLFRTAAGAPVALEDRCPHRSFPLSKSRLVGDQIVCGYHGLVYEASGRCVHIPTAPDAKPNLTVRAFPVVEQGPLVWIWLGEPDRADTDLIPSLPWLSDPAWATVTGGFHIRTNYIAMHENLLDQTHFTFLHAGTVGTPEWASAPLEVFQSDATVRLRRELKRSPPPGIYAQPMGVEGRLVDRVSEASFIGPAGHVAFATISNVEPPTQISDYRVNIVHLFTPETQNSIHYWWFNSRDFALQDTGASEFLRSSSEKAYLEDVEALEWISEAVHASPDPREVSFRSDRPGLLMRQKLLEMAMAEHSPQPHEAMA